MVCVQFAPNIRKHVPVPSTDVDARDVREALTAVFQANPQLRGYVLDDQDAVRHHVTIFVNDRTIRDRQHLTDPLNDGDQVYVFQALSGG